MSNYDKELAICEAAPIGPWAMAKEGGNYVIRAVNGLAIFADTNPVLMEYMATANPKRVIELLEAEREGGELRAMIERLEYQLSGAAVYIQDEDEEVAEHLNELCAEAKELLT